MADGDVKKIKQNKNFYRDTVCCIRQIKKEIFIYTRILKLVTKRKALGKKNPKRTKN